MYEWVSTNYFTKLQGYDLIHEVVNDQCPGMF